MPKIRRYTRFDDSDLSELLHLVESRIFFMDESFLPTEIVSKAKKLVENVDFNDFAFVALACHLDALLWTGDMILIEGLRKKGYRNVINTVELQELSERKPFL
jgi:predicted nucleic acid-binding protein